MFRGPRRETGMWGIEAVNMNTWYQCWGVFIAMASLAFASKNVAVLSSYSSSTFRILHLANRNTHSVANKTLTNDLPIS